MTASVSDFEQVKKKQKILHYNGSSHNTISLLQQDGKTSAKTSATWAKLSSSVAHLQGLQKK
jgi:hypothetical protein